MRQRIRLLKRIALLGTCIVMSALLSFLYFGVYRWNKMTEHYEREIARYKVDLSTDCYMLKRDVSENNPVMEEDLKNVKLPREMNAESIVIDKAKLKKASYSGDFKKGSILYQNMVYNYDNIKSDLRACELSEILLPKGIEVGNYVDLRIRFSNGLDFVVLSKKKLLSIERTEEDPEHSICRLHLNAEEILRVSSAIVDSAINEGAYLYGTVYLDSMTQKASKITYPNNAAVSELIKKDANIEVKNDASKPERSILHLKKEGQDEKRNPFEEDALEASQRIPKDEEQISEADASWMEEGDVIEDIDLSDGINLN